jgi:hypothetical protein
MGKVDVQRNAPDKPLSNLLEEFILNAGAFGFEVEKVVFARESCAKDKLVFEQTGRISDPKNPLIKFMGVEIGYD